MERFSRHDKVVVISNAHNIKSLCGNFKVIQPGEIFEFAEYQESDVVDVWLYDGHSLTGFYSDELQLMERYNPAHDPKPGDKMKVRINRVAGLKPAGWKPDFDTPTTFSTLESGDVITVDTVRPADFQWGITYISFSGTKQYIPLADLDPIGEDVCTCPIPVLMHQGCTCGHLSRQKDRS